MKKNRITDIFKNNYYSFLFIITVLYAAVLLFGVKDPEAVYSDAGFNYTQLIHFIESGYSDFSYNYRATSADPGEKLLPYSKPWTGSAHGKTYLQYPPWFYLPVLPFYSVFGVYGFLLFNLIFLSGLFYFLYRIILLQNNISAKTWVTVSFVLLMFGASMTYYSFHFHEYILSWFLSALSLFFGLKTAMAESGQPVKMNAFLSGLFMGLAVVLRLEIIVALFPVMVYLSFLNRKIQWSVAVMAGFGAAVPLLIFFAGNLWVHEHFLSLRYVNNVTDSNAKTPGMKLFYIKRILFEKEMGLLVQSPWVLAVPVIGYLYRKEKLIRISAIWFTLSTLAVLAALPNDGSHFAPRYLYAALPLAAAVTARPFADFSLKSIFLSSSDKKIKSGMILLILLIAVSFIKYKEQMVRQITYQTNIKAANHSLRSLPESELIVFREYASPQNSQFILAHRRFVVADTAEKARFLTNSFFGKGGFTVAFPVIGLPQREYSDEELRQLAKEAPLLNAEDFSQEAAEIKLVWPYLFLKYN